MVSTRAEENPAMFGRSCCAALVTIVAISIFAAAQDPRDNPGRITGRVADTAGTPIREATVILSRSGGETIAIGVTTPNGDYAVPALPPGSYAIQAFAV